MIQGFQNPVTWLETQYLADTQPFRALSWPKGLKLFGRFSTLVHWVLLIAAIALWGLSLLSKIFKLPVAGIERSDFLMGTWVIMVILVVGSMLSLVFRSLARGANLIVREHQAGRWETLLLTGLPARTIIRGKWWAAMRSLRSDVLYITVIRLIFALFLGLFFGSTVIQYQDALIGPSILMLFLAPIVIFIFTYGGVGVIVAVGLLVSSASTRPGRALAGAGVLLVGLWLGIAFVGQYFAFLYSFGNTGGVSNDFISMLIVAGVSVLENGTIVTGAMLQFDHGLNSGVFNLSTSELMYAIFSLIIAVGFYALLTWLLLFLAERLLMRRGALKQGA